ncbi:MAG: pectate lyase [Candidatus Poribacteria bacterium]|nr:MAG: pectate lyase [Candidatus Poribacteria bacterium]
MRWTLCLLALFVLTQVLPNSPAVAQGGDRADRTTRPAWEGSRLDFLPAFPGAEGYGARARGGRGGRVIAVTNLNDSGPGSLRAAIEAEGPRIVVFRVSGTIDLKSRLVIRNPFITIAGQTAPGDGVAIKRYPLIIDADEVVLRYLRLRLGDESGEAHDTLSARYHKNIIIDHVSASWSVDETMSVYHCEYVTVQWCLIAESLYESVHQKGTHGFGGIWGSNYSTYHHNLFAHHSSRTPRFAAGAGYVDYRNNVVYNWGYNNAYGGERRGRLDFTVINLVANYYKPGPATAAGAKRYRIVNPSSNDGADGFGLWYVAENYVHGYPEISADNWAGGVQPEGGDRYLKVLKLEAPWEAMPIHQQTAEEAYRLVLEHAGATLPRRDPVDARIVEEVRSGTATFGETYGGGGKGIINSPTAVGGWPPLQSEPAPPDTDSDGMPDAWEEGFGLDPQDPADGSQDRDGDGYTNIEEYLNGTDPTVFVDYTKPENNVNPFHSTGRFPVGPTTPARRP